MNATTQRVSLAQSANWTRYQPGQRAGHYESFFQRANHPARPLAFWIRYTLFSPAAQPAAALGELWAVCFNGETGQHVAVRQETPLAGCTFERARFGVQIAGAHLGPGALWGQAVSAGHTIAWDLAYTGAAAPLFLLPAGMYATALPRAKSLVGLPLAVYNGALVVDGEAIAIENWVGSQNHNWGARHTDLYAWGQVAGFDNAPDSFLELATARLKLGPVWTPPMTPIVLRHQGQEFALNSLWQTLRARGTFDYCTWRFRSTTPAIGIEGTLSAPREAFVGLAYRNPPGGVKHCLNTKLAACELTITRPAGARELLRTQQRAAFEILTDDRDHGIPIAA
ncbi:MAG: hypothetical protein NT169_22600 [Chloroflexi bacterium]|nr:hypothetical protein [Chloroflexota bacterium]